MTAQQTQPGADVALPSDRQAPPTIRAEIERMHDQFALAVPHGVEARQIVRDALTAISKEPKLAECTRASVLGGCMTVAQLGLRLGVLGHAWLIPFWNKSAPWKDDQGRDRKGAHEATLVIGYQGMITLAYRSGLVDRITARTVHERDHFVLEYGLDERLEHRPAAGDRGDAVGYYATVKIKGGGAPMFHYMTRAEVELYRDMHALSKWGPWAKHFDDMAKKTCLRQLAKFMPKGTDLAAAMAVDDTVRVDLTPTSDVTHVARHLESGGAPETARVADGELIDDVDVEDPPSER
jgi:recombination protein RecT